MQFHMLLNMYIITVEWTSGRLEAKLPAESIVVNYSQCRNVVTTFVAVAVAEVAELCP